MRPAYVDISFILNILLETEMSDLAGQILRAHIETRTS